MTCTCPIPLPAARTDPLMAPVVCAGGMKSPAGICCGTFANAYPLVEPNKTAPTTGCDDRTNAQPPTCNKLEGNNSLKSLPTRCLGFTVKVERPTVVPSERSV